MKRKKGGNLIGEAMASWPPVVSGLKGQHGHRTDDGNDDGAVAGLVDCGLVPDEVQPQQVLAERGRSQRLGDVEIRIIEIKNLLLRSRVKKKEEGHRRT